MSDLPSYKYQPLAQKQVIRLVQIKLDPNLRYGFSILLEGFALDDAPPFDALSYSWSAPQFPKNEADDLKAHHLFEIDCGGEILSVGENLFDFLCHLRDGGLYTRRSADHGTSQDVESSNLPEINVLNKPWKCQHIWIDAICIDQGNIRERSFQVQLMNRIYETAQSVKVWFGKLEPSDDVMWIHDHFIPAVINAYNGHTWYGFAIGNDRTVSTDMSDPHLIEIFGKATCERWRNTWLEFFDFFSKQTWYSRGWVVQEIVLQKREVAVLCGLKILDWQRLAKFFYIAHETSWGAVIKDRLREELDGWGGRGRVTVKAMGMPIQSELLLFENESTREYTMAIGLFGGNTDEDKHFSMVFWVLRSMRTYRFRDNRDYIYGVLGMLSQILTEKYHFDVTPNYDAKIEYVFAETTAILMKKMHTLDILSCAGLVRDRLSCLPSWVPDYTLDNAKGMLREGRGRYYCPFDASITKNARVEHFLAVNGLELEVEGAMFDNISEVGVCQDLMNMGFEDLKWLLKYCLQKGIYEPTGQSFAEVLLLTQSIGLAKQKEVTEKYKREWLLAAIASALARLQDPTRTEIMNMLPGESENGILPKRTEILEAVERRVDFRARVRANPLYSLSKFSEQRRVYRTRFGHLCLGSLTALGDELWLLKGARTPVLLRRIIPVEDGATGDSTEEVRYQLVEEVYVHGFMYGEMMTSELENRIGRVKIL